MIKINKGLQSIFLVVLIFNSFQVFSQTRDKEPNILVYIHSSDGTINTSLKDVLSKSISYELNIAEFNVINIENDTSIPELLNTAEWMGAFFVLEGIYSIKEDILSIVFNCYSVWDRETLVSVSNKNKLNLSTDQYIKDSLAEITPVIRDNLYIVEQITMAAEEQKIAEEDVIEPEPVVIKEYIPDQKEINQQELVQNILIEEESEPLQNNGIDKKGDNSEIVSPYMPGPFTIMAVIAPFLTTGEATEYFTRGIHFTLSGGYRINTSIGYLTPGVITSVDSFSAAGEETTSENILISLGPEIRMGINFNYIADIYVRFSFAGTIFMMDANNAGYENMLIPSISLGFGINYYFIENLGISIMSNYSIFLESSTIISGFLPSVGITYRFQGR